MNREDWIWMPHPAHFICSFDCRFHLATFVGEYIVSTVGEYFPDSPLREIFAKQRNVVLKGIGDERKYDYLNRVGFEEIGYKRKYETMVFKCSIQDEECCPYRIDATEQLDFDAYNSPGEATRGHMEMCLKWSDAARSADAKKAETQGRV